MDRYLSGQLPFTFRCEWYCATPYAQYSAYHYHASRCSRIVVFVLCSLARRILTKPDLSHCFLCRKLYQLYQTLATKPEIFGQGWVPVASHGKSKRQDRSPPAESSPAGGAEVLTRIFDIRTFILAKQKGFSTTLYIDLNWKLFGPIHFTTSCTWSQFGVNCDLFCNWQLWQDEFFFLSRCARLLHPKQIYHHFSYIKRHSALLSAHVTMY